MDRKEILRACTRSFEHTQRPIREQLLELAATVGDDEYPDRYGEGELLQSFESEIAQLLGKEAAVFMPSGTMAQQIALRIHCDRRNTKSVALHPQSHLLVSENNAMQTLHELEPIPVGDRLKLFSLDDLKKIPTKLGAVLLELPERNIGGPLRPWNELVEMCEWVRGHGIAMHLDGARLWESQPYYKKPLAEIVGLFHTAYVSFYKILGGIAGAALVGPKDFIDEARAWQWRHGGRLVQNYPTIVSAREGLRNNLPRIPTYIKRAQEIAEILASLDDIIVTPNPPPTNMMHVYIKGDRQNLEDAALQISQETKVRLPTAWRETSIPNWQMFELHCSEESLKITNPEVRTLFATLLQRARKTGH